MLQVLDYPQETNASKNLPVQITLTWTREEYRTALMIRQRTTGRQEPSPSFHLHLKRKVDSLSFSVSAESIILINHRS